MNHGHSHARSDGGATARFVANQRDLRANYALEGQAVDPTRTKSLRDQYARQIRKRYRALGRAIRTLVIDYDYLGLGGNPPAPGTRISLNAADLGFTGNAPDTLPVPDIPVPRRPGYSFPSDEQRAQRFREWLQNAQHAVVLGGPNDRWTDEYIRYAYGRGVVHGNTRLGQAGHTVDDIELRDAFNAPIHRDTLGMFYERQYELLDGVNQSMASDISQTLTDGMIQGRNPRPVGREMANTVQNIGVRRGNLIARTEIIYAYNEASLNRYEQILGSTGQLQAVLEFQTAGDSRVCDECASLEGTVYTVADARGVLPLHPSCRCCWLPVSRASN